MRPQVIIDCDPGLDDAIMLLALASQHRQERIHIVAVTTAAGNVKPEYTGRNARFLLDVAGLHEVPVFAGARRPMARIRETDATPFHGHDGIGGCFPANHAIVLGSGSAIDEIRLRLASPTEDLTILATGALTNLALSLNFFERDRLTRKPLVIMGGAFGAPAGNVTANAEFNFWFDPEAARRVFASEQPIRLVPLDVTERTTLGPSHVARLRGGGPASQYAASLIAASIANHFRELGINECHMHDALAAATLLDSSLVRCVRGDVTVLTSPQAEGHCIFERLHPKRAIHEVALEVDVDRARDWIIESLLALDS